MPRPLLSICIPTFNRAEILRESLECVTSDPDFDSRVEIVISDNCSPDNTQAVGEEFASRFPNVVYSRNDENIGQRNFMKVLSSASGEYVKLMNDYASFRPGALGRMLTEIEKRMESREQLFFCENNDFHRNVTIECSNADEFMQAVSHWVTWILIFGAWRELIPLIKNPYQFSDLRLDQVDWCLKLASMRPTSVVYSDFYDSHLVNNLKKSGYDLVDVFVYNYTTILRYHYDNGHITKATIKREQEHVYKYVILPYLYYIKIDKTCNLKADGAFGKLWRVYRFRPYFYTEPLRTGLRHAYFKLRSKIKI